ncbi:MAG TPA: hypothetical protein VF104_11680 [Burkholderiales bacterium]
MKKIVVSMLLVAVAGCASSGSGGGGGSYVGLDKSCENWLDNNLGLGYYALVSWAHGYLQSQVDVLLAAEKRSGNPVQGITEGEIAARLNSYCNANPRGAMPPTLQAWAKELMAGSGRTGSR